MDVINDDTTLTADEKLKKAYGILYGWRCGPPDAGAEDKSKNGT
jgi:hypothetical protein